MTNTTESPVPPNHDGATPAAPAIAVPSWVGALTGVIAAGVALAIGELISGFTATVPSLVIAVGELFVDKAPGAVVESGIQAAGTNDKPILLFTIVIASLLVGALIGREALTNRRRSDIGFLAFGLFGAWAAQRNPFSSTGWAIVAALAAAAAGALTVRVALGIASIPQVSTDVDGVAPADSFPARRAFLGLTGAAAVAAVGVSTLGRSLRNDRSVEAVRQQVSLPPAGGATASGAIATTGVVAKATPAAALDAVPSISSYITPSKTFYRIDNALVVPQVDPKKWKLAIGGLVDRPLELTYDDILAMDLVEKTVTLSCVSNPVGDKYVGNAVWRGVPLTTLLERAGVQPAGKQIVGISVDDFDASFPTELAYDGRTALLAVGMNGEPLPVIHGFPARLVVAGLYGYVSAVKWLQEIRLVDDDYEAYWIPRGWSKLGPIKTQSRIDVPRSSKVAAGNIAIGGVAWAPGKGIAKVEVQIDNGEWQSCTVGGATSDETWVQWKLDWDAKPGKHTIRVRATDKTGYTQGAKQVAPEPNGAEGQHAVSVTVA
ncbi:MAG: molybdopterin-dependent oxidoreductase [Actinobacteria bacterium]|nr:molybdopterin-dependent oxidoreductase [Actinomycetota bacterium]